MSSVLNLDRVAFTTSRQRACPDGHRGLRLILQSPYPEDLVRLKSSFFAAEDHNKVHGDLPLVNGLAVEVDNQSLPNFIEAMKGCRQVSATFDAPVSIPSFDEPTGPQANVAVPITRANELWQRGITGKGVGIAVLDTGIAHHTDVKNNVRAFHDVLSSREEAYDDHGHGTHVAALAAGDGTASDGLFQGAAPEAHLVSVKVLDSQGEGRFSDIIKGIQWAVENKERHGIKVLNLSLGGRAELPYREDPVVQALEAAWSEGLIPVVAAGNSGPFTRTITTPAHAQNVITVGASDDKGTFSLEDDKIGTFSSRGPTHPDGLNKPDVVAPGVRVTSADAFSDGYITKSGTSMSAPIVAGLVALLLEAYPEATPEQLKQALTSSARLLEGAGDLNVQGAGVVDVVAAWEALSGAAPTGCLTGRVGASS